MYRTIVREGANLVEFVAVFGAVVEYPGIPITRRITWCSRCAAVKARLPLPLDLVAYFDSDRGRDKIVARRCYLNSVGLGARQAGEAKRSQGGREQRAL